MDWSTFWYSFLSYFSKGGSIDGYYNGVYHNYGDGVTWVAFESEIDEVNAVVNYNNKYDSWQNTAIGKYFGGSKVEYGTLGFTQLANGSYAYVRGLYIDYNNSVPSVVINYDRGAEWQVNFNIELGVWVSASDIMGNESGSDNTQSQGAPMLESSFGANYANGMSTIVDGAVVATELSPATMLPRSGFNNVKASAAAGKVIAKGNLLLTWTAVAADGVDIYNNRAKATNADYAKWGTDVGLAVAGTGLLAVATFIPGVNVVAWGVALFVVSTANTYGAFDPLYLKLNK